MNIQQRLEAVKTRKKLLQKRQERIKNKVKAIQREKVNLDSTHLKTGKIQKMKFIAKKKYKTHVEKGRKIEVEIQDNANPGTFVSESSQYLSILERTRRYIQFSNQKLQNGSKAILAYAKANKQKTISILLSMKNYIQCHECPVLLKMPDEDHIFEHEAIIIAKNPNEVSKLLGIDSNIKLLTLKEFMQKYKNDKVFKKSIITNLCRIFCQFELFKSSKLLKKLLLSNFPVFPIDTKKVPYTLQSIYQNYAQYIEHLQKSCFAVVKSGTQHRIRMKIEGDTSETLSQKIKEAVYQMVSRLIYRNKNKVEGGNRLILVNLKTETSIPIEIYTPQSQ